MQKNNPKQIAVFQSLRSFFYAVGESVSLNMTVYISDEVTGIIETFYDVDVELMMSGDERCGIRIYCNDVKYEKLGMKISYTVKTAKFNFERSSDYQTSYNALKIQPNEFKSKFILLDAKEVNRTHV